MHKFIHLQTNKQAKTLKIKDYNFSSLEEVTTFRGGKQAKERRTKLAHPSD